MAITTFSKNIIVKYDTVNYPADTRNHLSRTYVDKVADSSGVAASTQVSVYFNGQKIPLRTAETVSTYAKYYFETTIDVNAPSIVIDIYSNSGYVNTLYDSMSPVNYEITDEDMFFVQYLYVVDI